jgi:hypothetical protein
MKKGKKQKQQHSLLLNSKNTYSKVFSHLRMSLQTLKLILKENFT